MAENQGIFNRNESMGRAQQDYDLYDFIANKPQGRRNIGHEVPLDDRMQDRLSRVLFAPMPEGMAPTAHPKGFLRPLLKMMIKSIAVLPVIVLYVGPRKVAHVISPILQKVLHLIPHLLQTALQQLQKQLQRLEPAINKVKVMMEKVVEFVKTTAEKVEKGFNGLQNFLARAVLEPLSNLADGFGNLLGRLLPEKGLSLGNPLDFAQQLLGTIKEFFLSKSRQFASDIKAELNDISRLAQKLMSPIAASYEAMMSYIKRVPEGIESIGSLIAEAAEKIAERINQALVIPLRHALERAKEFSDETMDKIKEIPEAVMAQLQIIVIPMINLLAAVHQFAREQKDKMKLSFIYWARDMNHRFKHYAGLVGEILHRANEKICEAVVVWFRQSWFVLFYRWLLQVVGKFVDAVVEKITQMVAALMERMKIWSSKAKAIRLVIAKNLRYFLLQLPTYIYKAVEWAFGKPGVLILQGIQFLGKHALRGLRYTKQLLHEAVAELVR